MQERRTTIRVANRCRAKYCPSDDLIPRDGQVANLSEQGLGLLTHEPHQAGEQMTISFFLPGAEDPVTATGVVRWSERKGKARHSIGLEWMPNEESIRHRLHDFLYQASRTPAARSSAPLVQGHKTARSIVRSDAVWMTLTIGGTLVALAWILALQRENDRLGEVVTQRETFIQQLEQREQKIQRELGVAKRHLMTAIEETSRLNEQAHRLTGDVKSLTQDVEQFQQSYVRSQEDREQLIERVMQLEQERTEMARKLSSVYELRVAIRDAIDSRKHTQSEQQRALNGAKREAIRQAERLEALNGNRGFVVRDGEPTVSGSTMWIKVYDPSDSSELPNPVSPIPAESAIPETIAPASDSSLPSMTPSPELFSPAIPETPSFEIAPLAPVPPPPVPSNATWAPAEPTADVQPDFGAD